MNIVLIISTQRTAGRIAVMETVQLNLAPYRHECKYNRR